MVQIITREPRMPYYHFVLCIIALTFLPLDMTEPSQGHLQLNRLKIRSI